MVNGTKAKFTVSDKNGAGELIIVITALDSSLIHTWKGLQRTLTQILTMKGHTRKDADTDMAS